MSLTKRTGREPALALFDIDGTLVRRAGPHHREALVEAVRRVAGIETTTDSIPVHGMLDCDILTRMLRNAGARAATIRRLMPDLVRNAQSVYVRRCPDLRRKVCPGVRSVLRRLERRGVVTGLVTGNLARIGWKKLERAGLRDYFRFGAFAELARTRADLVRIAVGRARAEGWIDREARVFLVGDHPNDVRAARANGVRSVAVATGLSSREELAGWEPDVLLDDLRQFRIATVLG